MSTELPKAYSPKETEGRIYKLWEESGFFTPENLPGNRKEVFSVALPPPNATGTLHLGHALEYSIQDAVVRYQRMRGKKTLWIPGTDHAAIATNTKVEKILIKEEGKNRHDIGREAFVKKVEDFVANSRGTIQKQLRQMGASLDWSREAFTMDDQRSHAVQIAFKRMYDAGLIYRGYRVINWDPKGQTSVSDDEVEHRPEKGVLYTFRYSRDFPIEIASTRPETKVGDTAIAVHPDDKRYRKYIGKEYDVEFAGTKLHIKVIADPEIDPEFGTGAVGVTPAHSIVDAEIAQRHNLPMVQVINEYAKMTDEAGSLAAGKKTKEAREVIVRWLKENELLSEEKEIELNISIAERSGGIIEPLPKLQWFVSVNKEFVIEKSSIKGVVSGSKTTLKEIMRKSVANGQVEIIPEREEKKYFHWIDNLRDWNISRQLWYGHRIPVWYHEPKCIPRPGREEDIKNCLETVISFEEPKCEFCDAKFTQDPDTLDTWFSSALWTFSTLGWPDENSSDLKTYHPTSFMNPGYEILFFWVARMILMSGFLLGEIPFKTVYLHGILRDSKGQKFSKSLDTGTNPVDVIEQYGTDALRMSVLVGIAPGNDGNFSLDKVKAYKHFANKLWNIARFVLISIPDDASDIMDDRLVPEDEKILAELGVFVKGITEHMDNYRLYLAADEIYHYVWHTFADKIVEESKAKLASEDPAVKASTQRMLTEMLTTSLKLLHPFMPFVTEEIYSKLP
ncbi:MAG TPA: valine--tRNA ligase, partial [Candidatus Paceibacterota bacterium]|nr:valine--tRNA ligase [Candidatus Paceibacterota bacterium]